MVPATTRIQMGTIALANAAASRKNGRNPFRASGNPLGGVPARRTVTDADIERLLGRYRAVLRLGDGGQRLEVRAAGGRVSPPGAEDERHRREDTDGEDDV